MLRHEFMMQLLHGFTVFSEKFGFEQNDCGQLLAHGPDPQAQAKRSVLNACSPAGSA